jgi:GMP synthase-like glutamine amidotransferase
MKPIIHFIDVTDFTLPDGTGGADWFRDAFEDLGLLGAIEFIVHDGTAGAFPRLAEAARAGHGIVVPGSSGPILEKKPWITPLIEYLKEAHGENAWILGICFGHHALASALGGQVAFNSRGREMGTVPVYLTKEGEACPLFRDFVSGDLANLVHRTHVTKLPRGAVRLAFNQMTPTQAFRLGRSFGIQPHPEFTPSVLVQLTALYGRVLIGKEHFLDDVEHLENFKRTFHDAPSFRLTLRNFVEMVASEEPLD